MLVGGVCGFIGDWSDMDLLVGMSADLWVGLLWLVVTLLVFVGGILRLVGWLVVGLDYLGKRLFYCDFGEVGLFCAFDAL